MLPVMEGTRPAIAVPDALELYEFSNDRDDVGLFADALDDIVGDHANSATVTPVPPSFHAPESKLFYARVLAQHLRDALAERSRPLAVNDPERLHAGAHGASSP